MGVYRLGISSSTSVRGILWGNAPPTNLAQGVGFGAIFFLVSDDMGMEVPVGEIRHSGCWNFRAATCTFGPFGIDGGSAAASGFRV